MSPRNRIGAPIVARHLFGSILGEHTLGGIPNEMIEANRAKKDRLEPPPRAIRVFNAFEWHREHGVFKLPPLFAAYARIRRRDRVNRVLACVRRTQELKSARVRPYDTREDIGPTSSGEKHPRPEDREPVGGNCELREIDGVRCCCIQQPVLERNDHPSCIACVGVFVVGIVRPDVTVISEKHGGASGDLEMYLRSAGRMLTGRKSFQSSDQQANTEFRVTLKKARHILAQLPTGVIVILLSGYWSVQNPAIPHRGRRRVGDTIPEDRAVDIHNEVGIVLRDATNSARQRWHVFMRMLVKPIAGHQ